MDELTKEEIERIRNTPIQDLLESGEWVKLYDLPRPSLIIYDYSAYEFDEKIRKEGDAKDE